MEPESPSDSVMQPPLESSMRDATPDDSVFEGAVVVDAAAWLHRWVAVIYLVLAVASTWPLPMKAMSEISLGSEREFTVPLFNLWTLWWNADRLAAGGSDYWNSPIFAPTPSTFAFSEPQPPMIIAAPAYWMTGRIAFAYNVYLWLVLWANGGTGYALLRSAGHATVPALFGGAMAMWLPWVYWQMGAIQLTTVCGTQLTLIAALHYARTPNISSGISFGAAFGLCYLLCNYYGLYLAVLLIPTGCCFLGRQFLSRSAAVSLFFVVAAVLIVAGPLIRIQRSLSVEHLWHRPPDIVRGLSALPSDYTDLYGNTFAPFGRWGDEPRTRIWQLGPGWIKLGAALLGVGLGLARCDRRRWTIAVLLFGALAAVLSFGLHAEWRGVSAFGLLAEWAPGFRHVRSPFRFAVFVQLAVVWLATEPISRLWQVADRRSVRTEAWIRSLTVAMGCLLLCDGVPYRQRTTPLPDESEHPVWRDWLRDHIPADAMVLCLPFPLGAEVRAYEPEVEWMFHSMHHRRRLVNGYSGFFPDQYLQWKSRMTARLTLPDGKETVVPAKLEAAVLDDMSAAGVRFVAVKTRDYPRTMVEADLEIRARMQFRIEDVRAQIAIYELVRQK